MKPFCARCLGLFALLLCACLLLAGCGGSGPGLWESLEAWLFPASPVAQEPSSYRDIFEDAYSGAEPEPADGFDLLLDDTGKVSLRRNIRYREGKDFGDESGLLDACVPHGLEAGEKRPLVVIIHGGSWSGGKKEEVEQYMLTLANLGYVAAAANYRLLPQNGLAEQVEDVLDAVQFLVNSDSSQMPLDKEQIYLMGMSAGGHLCLLTAYSKGEGFVERAKRNGYTYSIKGVLSLSSPVRFDNLEAEFALRFGAKNVRDEVSNFLGGDPAEDPSLLEAASPLGYIVADTPTTLILHGTDDDSVPVEDAEILYETLKEAGVPSELHRLEGMGHGLDAAAVLEICYSFLKQQTGVGLL